MPLRELGERYAHGILVTLFWDPANDSVTLRYQDEQTGDQFVSSVPRRRALDAFRHPNAYRPDAKAAQ